jgi:hypothetical protein
LNIGIITRQYEADMRKQFEKHTKILKKKERDLEYSRILKSKKEQEYTLSTSNSLAITSEDKKSVNQMLSLTYETTYNDLLVGLDAEKDEHYRKHRFQRIEENYENTKMMRQLNNEPPLSDQQLLDEKFKKKRATYEKLTNTITALDTVNMGFQLFNDISAKNNEIGEIENQIKINDANYETLKSTEQDVADFENIVLKNNLEKLLIIRSIESANKSHSTLTYNEWKMKENLHELSSMIQKIVTIESAGLNELSNTFSRIQIGIEALLDIHSHIETFYQQIKLARYIAAVTSNQHNIGIPTQYKDQVNKLERIIHENVISDLYEEAKKAFKLWSFPFQCEYEKLLMNHDQPTSNSTSTFSNNKVIEYSRILEEMFKIVKEDNFKITAKDNHMNTKSFEISETKFDSFFKWSSKKYPFELNQLLFKGLPVTLYSDINEFHQNNKYDALKFSTIYLHLSVLSEEKSPNEMNELNKNLTNYLTNFHVELSYAGKSNYIFKDESYSFNLNSGELVLRYRYNCNEEMKKSKTCEMNSNNSFKKLSANKPLISPFTIWKIELIPIRTNGNDDQRMNYFKNIEKIIKNVVNEPEIVISLHGHAQYVDSKYDNSSCDSSIAE